MSEKDLASNVTDMPIEEAIVRFLKTKSKELADVQEDVKRKQNEIEANVEKTREDIRRGVRPAGKRFRI